jgi:DNA-binding protein Fis
MSETGGNQRMAAELLGMNYQTLYKRIPRLNILATDKK